MAFFFSFQLDSRVLKGWANNDPKYDNSSLIKQCGGNVTDPIPCGKLIFVQILLKKHIFEEHVEITSSLHQMVFFFSKTLAWKIGL